MSVTLDQIKKAGLPAGVPDDAPLREVPARIAQKWKDADGFSDRQNLPVRLDEILPHTVHNNNYILGNGRTPREQLLVNFQSDLFAGDDGTRTRVWFATTAQEWQEPNPDAAKPGQPAMITHRAVFWFSD